MNRKPYNPVGEDDATELDLVYEDLRHAKMRIRALEAALREIIAETKSMPTYMIALAALAKEHGA